MAEPVVPAEDSTDDVVASTAKYLAEHTDQLKADLVAGHRGIDIAEAYAHMYDGLFGQLCERAGVAAGGDHPPIAVVAMGGYGRAMVAPHSDVDVLFLCDDAADPLVAQFAELVLYPLWNAGVDVGHAVRGLDATLELSRTDIRTATTLLDLRHIAGDRGLTDRLVERGRTEILEASFEAFLSALVADTEGRHERYGGTLYLREPELKWGRGGLRDIDVIGWIARARWNVAGVDALFETDAMSEREWADLRASRDHLWSVRTHLHGLARRRQDRLTFEDQETIADRLGYLSNSTLAVEQFMQAHYRHARSVARLVDIMAERARRSRRPPPTTIRDLGNALVVHDEHVVMDDSALLSDPAVCFRLFLAALNERVPPEPRSRDSLSAATNDREWAQNLRRAPDSGPLFLKLLVDTRRAPMRRASTMEALNELGVLIAMIPEFEPVVGRVPHDAYYAYTVDVQAVKAVDTLRALERGELASQYVVASRCAAELPRSEPLYLALLLHAIGATHPDDPASYAAAVAGPIAQRLGLSSAATEHVQWLISNQGAFYHWAMRRDITDPETIAEVATAAGTVYRLRDLYLLTFCKVCTANPKAMTAWNARMLKDLWTAALDALEGRDDREGQLRHLEEDAVASGVDAHESALIASFVREMPDRYLLANSAMGIRSHALAVDREGDEPVIVGVPSGVGPGALELVVACVDRPGVLADLSAALACSRFDVDSAQLYTRRRQGGQTEAVDLFHVTHRSALSPGELEQELDSLRAVMLAVLRGERAAVDLVRSRSTAPSWARTGPRIKTEIHVDNEASSKYTVVDVYTRDRDVLLHAIAETFRKNGLSIVLAKVNTEGERAADVFYVEQLGGGKLASQGSFKGLCDDLRRSIHRLDRA